ncbi:hypothetical protein OPIT5_13865 [Opitutaceae bacterium TAV5]|nr:hypothetical protein OPIT5_13865 [Opitutaceae bacterium TAV5]
MIAARAEEKRKRKTIMNDNDLKKHLSALAPPVPDASVRENARLAALGALAGDAASVADAGRTLATMPGSRDRSDIGGLCRRRGFRELFPAAAALVATLVILGVFIWRPAGPSAPGARDGRNAAALPVDDAREMLAQVEKLFPGQLNAVIERNGAVRIEVSEPSSIPARSSAATVTVAPLTDSQPLVVQLQRGTERLRVLSYSGRSVCLDLNGSRVCFDVLATADGGVLLAGADFLWSPAHPVRVAGYEIRARSLSIIPFATPSPTPPPVHET